MSTPKDRYEPDDELYVGEASVNLERMDNDGLFLSVFSKNGTHYRISLVSETVIEWWAEVEPPQWCHMNKDGPGCSTCFQQWYHSQDQEGLKLSRLFLLAGERGMILCTECGNKRCPKATWHGYKCTRSNKPGQLGDPE